MGAYEEINRLKNQLENNNYNIDKLELKIHKTIDLSYSYQVRILEFQQLIFPLQ